MSNVNVKDMLDHGLCLSEASTAAQTYEYETYLIDQLVFLRGVEKQEISLGTDPRQVTRNSIRNIIKLLNT